jgi:hypothetical protein
MKAQDLKALLLLAVGLGVFSALGFLSIHVPLGRDQGVAAYVAEVMARGGAVYGDVYHFNLPGIFFTYLLARASGLGWPESVNLLHVIFTVLAYVAVFLAGRRLLSPLAAAFSALFYGSFAVVMYTDYWDIAQKDSLACLPLSLALLFYLKVSPDKGAVDGTEDDAGDQTRKAAPGRPGLFVSSLLAGLFTGAAAQFKPTLGIVLLVALYAAWEHWRRPGRAAVVFMGCVLGFAVSFLPLLAYLAHYNALDTMLDSVVRFGSFYGVQHYDDAGGALVSTGKSLARWLYNWRFLAVLAIVAKAVRTRDSRLRLVALFGALLLIQVVIQMKFFSYHWIPLLVPGSILAAAGGSRLLRDKEGKASEAGAGRYSLYRNALVVILIALFIGNLWPEAKRYNREYLFYQGRIDSVNFLSPYGPWGRGDVCPLAMREAAGYIMRNTAPDDPVLVFGHELGLYVLAKRFAPTRFAYDQPLVTDPGDSAEFARYRDALRAEFIADLEAAPPVYIVVMEDDRTGIEPEDSYTQMQSFPELKERIEQYYQLETIIEDYHIFRRTARAAGRGTR